MKLLKPKFSSFILVSVLVISIFTLFFAASISYRQLQTVTDSENLIVHSYKIYVDLERLDLFLKDAETSQRGFLLTRDSSFLRPFYEAMGEINISFISLKSLVKDNSEQSNSLDTLIGLINKRFSYLNLVLKGNDFKVSASDTLKKLISEGRDIMTQSKGFIDNMEANELQLLKIRETVHANDLKLSPFSILFIVMFSLFVFISSFYRINKDLKGLAKINNQLLINNEIFEHSEQIAEISHWNMNIQENKLNYSNNLYRLLGCTVQEFEPTFLNFLEFVHPDDRQILVEGHQKTINESLTTRTYFRVIRKDGVERHFKSIGKIITDSYGTRFSIGINADITEQYSRDKLIEEKLADLERTNKQLSAFNHIASHDLQEPVRKVQTFLSRIWEKDSESIPEKVKDYLAGIGKAANRMQKFIEDLLLYSRTSRSDKIYEAADLNEILDYAKRDLSQLIEDKKAIIHCYVTLPTINVIQFQIQQLLINLISNSIKYSRPDINPVINIDSKLVYGKDIPDTHNNKDKPYHKISITDNGIGFDQKYAEKIFEPFFRLHTNQEYSGTGIGLSICKIIVENHKGFIEAEGYPQAGSIFSIFLPVETG